METYTVSEVTKQRILSTIKKHPGLNAIELRKFGIIPHDGRALIELEQQGFIVFNSGWEVVEKG